MLVVLIVGAAVGLLVPLGLGLGLDMFFDMNSIRGSNSVDGVCDFESVPPDQLCPGAKRD